MFGERAGRASCSIASATVLGIRVGERVAVYAWRRGMRGLEIVVVERSHLVEVIEDAPRDGTIELA